MRLSVHLIVASCLAGLLCLASSASGAGFIVGVSWDGAFVSIDPDTGVYTKLGNTATDSNNALAQDSHGDLYRSYLYGYVGNGYVSRVNPVNWWDLQTFTIPAPASDIRGLAFDQSNSLFAVVNGGDAYADPDNLYKLDLGSQTATLIGSLGFAGVQALDVSPNGTFFAWDVVGGGLLTVNPVTGAAADVNPARGGPDIQSIVFAPDGRLFGAGHQLYSIDPVTGACTPIGAGGGPDVRGIEWIVPEPATSLLLIMAVMMIMAVRRR